ncbi:mannose-6-phosphate isomerase 1-like [Silene latifolia]|uniref:mannose-6-phosphate isomerase 1-like n=1 Tax=Silene latifolia TaxID=37657 RepID=UPI003D77502D
MEYIFDGESYLLLLRISLIFLGICLISLLKRKKISLDDINHKKKKMGVLDSNNNGVWRNEEKLQRLRCTVKNYDWGRFGTNTEVFRLYKANSGLNSSSIDPNKPYAELWMGTHESGSSFVERKDNFLVNGDVNHGFSVVHAKCGGFEGETLKNWIEKHPHVLGNKVLEKWGCDLPFLFKVLSVAKPLSIQAHPCKELAKTLHLKYPTVYKDENHKPEMALAVTKFEILCGFVGMEALQKTLVNVPEISQLVGSAVVDRVAKITPEDKEEDVKAALKQLFTQIMSASDHLIAEVLSLLISRLRKKDKLTPEEKLVLRLEEQYPGDVGVLAAFLMNFITLNPGEALCLGANELHAYVSGECIECMATSDNVVRAGLTPKQRDVQTLCEMLTYKQGCPEILRGFNVEGTDGCTKRYRPPFEEFEVDHCHLSDGRTISFPSVAGPSLFLVTQGTGLLRAGFSTEKIKAGDVLFAPANSKLSISSESRLEIYRAGVNSKFL